MPPLDFINNNAQTFARGGSVVATYRSRGTKRYGPYYRVAYRIAGRQCSLYLGRCKQLADSARELLAKLQHPRDFYRLCKRANRQRRATLRRVIRHWQQTIRSHGLNLRWLRNPRLAHPRHPSLRQDHPSQRRPKSRRNDPTHITVNLDKLHPHRRPSILAKPNLC